MKQALDWSGETEEPNNQLMLHPMASAPWQSMKSVYDPGEGVYAPVQQELSRHGLTARCDRPRLGLKWPEKAISFELRLGETPPKSIQTPHFPAS